MAVLLVGDVHLADRAPASCTESYTDDLFDLLRQVVDLDQVHRYSAVVFAGDVFHVKAASRNSHRLVQRVIDLCQAFREPPFIVPGNHDMEHDRLASLDKQPLGTVFKAGAARPLVAGGDLLHGGNFTVSGVEWQQDWSQFEPALPVGTIPARHLVVAHAPLYPPHLPRPPFEWLDMEKWAHVQQDGYVYYGHVHECHGVNQVDGVTFCNQGAITRGSLHEDDLTRRPAVTSWDPDRDPPFMRIELDSKPASEVFRLEEAGAARTMRLRLDTFMESVGTTVVDRLTPDVLASAAAERLSSEAAALVRELVQP